MFLAFAQCALYVTMRTQIENFRAFQSMLAERFATLTNAELMQFFDDNDLPGRLFLYCAMASVVMVP